MTNATDGPVGAAALRRLLQGAMERLAARKSTPEGQHRIANYCLGASLRQLGIEALCDGRYEEAAQHFASAMRTLGPSSDLGRYLACAHARAGRIGECADAMENVAALDDDAETYRRLAIAQWQAGRHQHAMLTLSNALRRFGGSCALHLQMGLFHAASENYTSARRHLALAAKADAANADAHRYLALAAGADHDAPAAFRSFQRAFALRPDDLVLARQLSLAAQAAADAGCPVEIHLQQRMTPQANSPAVQLAEYACSEADFIEAFFALPPDDSDEKLFSLLSDVLQIAVRRHSDYADLHYHLSRTMQRLGRTRDALRHARRAIEINPQYARALLHLAQMTSDAGREIEAAKLLDVAIAAGADWADVHCQAGRLHARLERVEDARRHYRRALELNADYRPAAEALETLAA